MSFESLVQACSPVFELFKSLIESFPAPFLLLAGAGFGTFILIYVLKWITG